MVNIWRDAFAPTSLGTSVTSTTLNGGADYNVTQKAGALLEVIPQVAQTGALTAAEAMMIRSEATSSAIPTLTPKEFVFSAGLGGLGTFAFAQTPLLQARKYNTVLPRSTTPITFLGEAQIANTVAPEMNMELVFTDGGPTGPEQFYLAPAAETNTGTAAANVAGNDITINGGTALNWLSVVLTNGVVTASETFEARAEFASTNYINVPSPVRIQAQTIAAALGTAVAVATTGDSWRQVYIPIGNTCLINTSLDLDEAQTATGNFICQVGYLK